MRPQICPCGFVASAGVMVKLQGLVDIKITDKHLGPVLVSPEQAAETSGAGGMLEEMRNTCEVLV